MPTFDTPDPIDVTIDVSISKVWISATDRTDSVVEIRPVEEGNKLDLKAVAQTSAQFTNGTLLVKQAGQNRPFGKVGTTEISIQIPAGSRIQGKIGVGDFRTEGELGECRFKSGVGDIMLDRTGRLSAQTGTGSVFLESATGHVEISGGGTVRIGEIEGTAVVKNSIGTTEIGMVTDDLRVNSATGNIVIDTVGASVGAKSAMGTVRVNSLVRGSAVLESSTGDVEFGIREGSSAWLDVKSSVGRVRNSLEHSDGPGQSDETVKVRARSTTGDIAIFRA